MKASTTPARTRDAPRLLAVTAVCAALGWAPAGEAPGSAHQAEGAPVGPPDASPPHEALQEPRAPRTADREPARQGAERGPERGHDFYFTRAVYTGGRGFRRAGAWATDFPKADRQFLYVLSRLLEVLDLYEGENPVRLDDPELRRFPFLYVLEVGYMDLTEPEVEGLRDYLKAGGFLFVDDFWGTLEWANFEREMERVLPGRRIVDLPLDHPIFHQFYDIDEIVQVPSLPNALRGRTWERDGVVPRARGILDDDGELMVLINWNTDLGDAWEWSEHPFYPIDRSSFAYELAVNAIIYALSH